jgi:hypothetical protein
VSLVVVGPVVDRPWPTTLLPPRSNRKPEAATAVYKHLMMGKRMPDTCLAVFERRAINLRVLCIWSVHLFECMMMHVLINPKNLLCFVAAHTVRFIMFSVFTNIYNKKTKGPTLIDLFTATGKLKQLVLTNIDIRYVHHGWHGTHRYDIQVLATHTSTWVHRYSSLFAQTPLSVNCLYHARMVLSVGRSFAYFAQNARCTVTTDLLVWYSSTQKDFYPGAAICSLHTLASPSGRNLNYDKKTSDWEKILLSFSFYLYTFCKYVSYGFPIINFCNTGVHYEKPWM